MIYWKIWLSTSAVFFLCLIIRSKDKDVEPKDSNDVDMKDADSKENSQEKTSDDSEKLKEDDAIDDSRFQLLEKGRCARLLTSEVALKALEIIFQWSLAGVAVKPTSDHMHTHLIRSINNHNIELEIFYMSMVHFEKASRN